MGHSSNRPGLSVAAIVRNCAALLPRTLGSVAGIADEIVLLDTGSTDDTPTIAAKLGARLFRQPWDDHFAVARNTCLAHCTGDWILWLDAGEQLSSDAAAALRRFLDERADPGHAYRLPIALLAGDYAPAEQVCQIRLHPRQPGIQFAGRVRESVEASLTAAGIAIESLAIPLEKLEDEDPLAKVAKAQRNIRLADRALAEAGPSAEMHNCLGAALQALGDPRRAGHQYRQAQRLAAKASPPALEAYYGLLTCLDCGMQNRDTQLALVMEALEQFPLDAQLLVAMGGYLNALGYVPLAIRAYDVAYRHGQIEPRIAHLPDIGEIAAACAAATHQAHGNLAEARTLLEAAVRSHPNSSRLARQLVALLAAQNLPREARTALESLPPQIQAVIERELPAELQRRLRLDQPRAAVSPAATAADVVSGR
jgi:glycosyltransferase involved in cell wall biosynthesis